MEIVEVIIQLTPLWLLIIAWFTGSAVERSHFRSLALRESQVSSTLVTDLRSFPLAGTQPKPPKIVVAEVVIATDYLKSFLAALRKIIGGEMRSYLKLVERARREAILRVVEEARQQGYTAVCNIRLDSSDVAGTANRRGAAMVTLIASGTAYNAERAGSP
jgi:uncharacterized protein YbjQ (UPF0145 family)